MTTSSSLKELLLIQLLLLSCHLTTAQASCPAPFNIEAGKCVFVERQEIHTWCLANLACQSMGGELINKYSSLKLLNQMPSVNCAGCRLWYGLHDLADERGQQKTGWQRVNDNGILPYNSSMWYLGMPSSDGNQDCISRPSSAVTFVDSACTNLRGFACEYKVKAKAFTMATWTKAEFSRTEYNPRWDYCYTEVRAYSVVECVVAAMTDGNTKHVLFNKKSKICRLLLFSDVQVDEWIETGADWVKFSV